MERKGSAPDMSGAQSTCFPFLTHGVYRMGANPVSCLMSHVSCPSSAAMTSTNSFQYFMRKVGLCINLLV